MKALISRIFLSLLISAVDTIPTPELRTNWKDYSDLLNRIYPDYSSIEIYCKLPDDQPCPNGGQLELYEETAKISIKGPECWNVTYFGYLPILRLNFNDSTILDKRFKCRYHEGNAVQESTAVSIPWVFCSHGSQDCDSTACPNDNAHVCMWTRNGTRPCSKIDHTDYCKSEGKLHRYCPVDEVGECSAVVKNRSAIWYQVWREANCLAVSSPPVTYKGKALLHGEIFKFDPAWPFIRFDCCIGSPFFKSTIDIFGTAVEPKSATCMCGMDIYLDSRRIGYGTGIHYIHLHVPLPDTTAEFRFLVVVFGNKLTIKSREYLDNTVICVHDVPVFSPLGDFRGVRWVTKTGSEKRIQTGFQTSVLYDDLHFNITESGWYQCHAEITFQTCAPHTKFVKKLESGFIFIEYQTATTTTQTKTTQPTSIAAAGKNKIDASPTATSQACPLFSLGQMHLTLALQFVAFYQI